MGRIIRPDAANDPTSGLDKLKKPSTIFNKQQATSNKQQATSNKQQATSNNYLTNYFFA
jgi:hypothetical protein